jgi:hypothetical protein
MNGRANAPCIPFGTFKAKITNGEYIDVLVNEPNGNQYSVGFEIVQAERNPAPVNGDEARPAPQASAPVVAVASQIQPSKPTSTTAVSPAAAQPQPATPDAAPAAKPEVSVAEAARQARIAKAVREAKEKAERDNPPPPQR